MTADPRKFLLNTDYEMDKIIYFTSGTITADEGAKTIAHNLSFTPLVFGICAFNSDFTDSRTIPYLYQTQTNTTQLEAKANSTNIEITCLNYEDPTATMYYRIYAFEPSNSTAEVSPTSGNASKFVLNTDYNYCKLFSKGILDNTVGTHTIDHNLGYIPQVLAWGEKNGYTFPIENNQPEDPTTTPPEPFYIAVTNSNITIRDNDGQNPSVTGQTWEKVHYRIYYDEA